VNTALSLLDLYIETNLLVVLAWVVGRGVRTLVWRGRLPARAGLTAARLALACALFGPAVASLLPHHSLFPAAAQLWESDVAPQIAAQPAASPSPSLGRARAQEKSDLPKPTTQALLLTLLAAALLARSARTSRGLHALVRLARTTPRLRRIGRLDVRLSSETAVPLSFRLGLTAYVLLPEDMAGDAEGLRIAVAHEGQHHRHGDTAWLIGLEVVKALLPLNPAWPFWQGLLTDLSEFACDEALVGRGRFSPHAYGRCLIRVSEAALSRRRVLLVGTAGMAAASHDPGKSLQLLKRRIIMLRLYPSTAAGGRHRGLNRFAATAAVASLVLGFAYAAQGAKAHAPLTLDDAQKIASQIETSPDFPLPVNERVLTRLNQIITDPARAASVKDALGRMPPVAPMIRSALERYGLPNALLAVPLEESGYQNLPEKEWKHRFPSTTGSGAGLWMFIRQTARAYGLEVSATTDERLDTTLETDAAMRLLDADHLRFKDWLLALAAYNQGEDRVQAAIDQGGSRDVWQLEDQGLLNDYVAHVVAGVIIVNRPDLLD